MKTHSFHSFAAGAIALSLLAFAGCTSAPTRTATLESNVVSANPDDGFQPPVALRTVEPLYPIDMKRAGISGMIELTCRVDEQGKVRDPKVDYSTNTAFNEPALESVRQWSFKPAERNGEITAMWIKVPIRFTLTD